MKLSDRRTLVVLMLAMPVMGLAKTLATAGASKAVVAGVDVAVEFASKSSVITPAFDKQLKSVVARAQAFHVVGRGDVHYTPGLALSRASAIRERLIAHGADVETITCVEAGPREMAGKKFTSDVVVVDRIETLETPWKFDPVDQTLAQVLTRWGAMNGWRVVWDAGRDVPASALRSTRCQGGFLQAASALIASAQAMGHSLHPEAYSNNVLVIK